MLDRLLLCLVWGLHAATALQWQQCDSGALQLVAEDADGALNKLTESVTLSTECSSASSAGSITLPVGVMIKTWKTSDNNAARDAMVKIYKDARYKDLAQVLIQLYTPEESGTWDGTFMSTNGPAVAFENVEGKTMEKCLDELGCDVKKLPVCDTLPKNLYRGALTALHAIHAAGVVHGCTLPKNVMVQGECTNPTGIKFLVPTGSVPKNAGEEARYPRADVFAPTLPTQFITGLDKADYGKVINDMSALFQYQADQEAMVINNRFDARSGQSIEWNHNEKNLGNKNIENFMGQEAERLRAIGGPLTLTANAARPVCVSKTHTKSCRDVTKPEDCQDYCSTRGIGVFSGLSGKKGHYQCHWTPPSSTSDKGECRVFGNAGSSLLLKDMLKCSDTCKAPAAAAGSSMRFLRKNK